MKYGYFNGYITDIGEDIAAETEELKPLVDTLKIDTLSYRPELNKIIDSLLPGDEVYVYSFKRFCSGLKDLCALLTEIVDERKAEVISLHDDFDSRTEKGRIAQEVYRRAIPLSSADPSYGFYH